MSTAETNKNEPAEEQLDTTTEATDVETVTEDKAEETTADTTPAETQEPAADSTDTETEASQESDGSDEDGEEETTIDMGNPDHRWYIIHAFSGSEKTVARQIEDQAARAGLTDKISQILVPTEEVVEVRRGKKVNKERRFFPGYVLIQMDMVDALWHLIKNIPKVTDFLGAKGKPAPISSKEALRIMQQVQEGIDKPRPSITFEVGEKVKVTDGPFNSFIGTVADIDEPNARMTVEVSIFGRATPVELDYTQVQKDID